MVIVRVEILLNGVKLHGDDLVCGVPVGGSVGEAEKPAGAVGRDGRRRSNDEGDSLAGSVVLRTENVDEKGSVEGNQFSVEVIVPERERIFEEDSAGVVAEFDVGAVRSNLQRAEVDGGGGDHLEGVEVGLVERTESVGLCFENLSLRSRRRKEEENGGDGGDGGGVITSHAAL